MASKPTTEPQWDSANTNATEPTTEKTSGWAVNQTGVSSFMNWWMRLVWNWIQYLKDGVIVGEAGAAGLTVTGGTGNTRGILATGVGTGVGVRGVGGASDGKGVEGQGVGNGAGVHGAGGVGTGPGGLFNGGSSAGPGIDATGGSGGNGANLFGNGAGYGASIIGGNNARGANIQAGGGNNMGVNAVGAGTGAGVVATGGGSGGVGLQALVGAGATVGVQSDGYVELTGANPASTDAMTDKLTPANIPKCWGTASTGGSPALLEGFNVASVTVNAGRLRVQMAAPMASSNYCVVPAGPSAGRTVSPVIVDADEFEIECNDAAGAAIDLSAQNFTFHFAVFGKQ